MGIKKTHISHQTYSCRVIRPEWTLFELAHRFGWGKRQNTEHHNQNHIQANQYVIIRRSKLCIPNEAKEHVFFCADKLLRSRSELFHI